MDTVSKKKRSEMMSKIRSKGNKSTGLRFVALFREYGITGWRRNSKLVGHPDFVFPKYRVVVFVDGCFGTDAGFATKATCRTPTRRFGAIKSKQM